MPTENNLGQTPGGPTVDGQRYSWDVALKDPLKLARIIAWSPEAWVTDYLLRRATTESGAVVYNQARRNGAYPAKGGPQIVAPAADFPLIDISEEAPTTALAEKVGVAFRVTDESVRRKAYDEVARAVFIATNALRRQNAHQCYQAFVDSGVPTTNAVASWASPDAADPRRDILKAQSSIRGTRLGYDPRSVLAHPNTLTELMLNPKLATWMPRENPALNPYLNPGLNGFLSVEYVETTEMPEDEVIVFQRNIVGADVVEREINVEPIRESGQKTLYQVSRSSVPVITDPLAAVRIQGVLV